jgi:hypothetical protein
MISIKHLVPFFNKSRLVNSFGECILFGKIVLPTQIESISKISLKTYIGPVPDEETFNTMPLNIFDAESTIIFTYLLFRGVLKDGSPLR